jgi:serine/threonine protein kinase
MLYIREHPEINFTLEDSIGFNIIREPIELNKLPSIPPWWLKELKELIISCLSINPEERPSFEEILKILESINDEDNWFIQNNSSKTIYELLKEEKNKKQFIEEYEVNETITNIFNNVPDIESSFYIIMSKFEIIDYFENKNEEIINIINDLVIISNNNLDLFIKIFEKNGFSFFLF